MDQSEGAAQDGRKRALILVEHHSTCVGIEGQEFFEGGAGCAAETENRLIRIADGEDVALLAGEERQEFDLAPIAVLELVDQDEAGAGTLVSKLFGIGAQHLDGCGNHLPVEDPAVFAENGFYGGENAGNLVATREDFIASRLVSFFEFSNARQRKVALSQTLDVSRIVSGGPHVVVAAIEELEQVMQKFSGIAGLAEVMQVERTDVLAQVDPQIFFLDVFEILACAAQHALAITVDGVGLNVFRRSGSLDPDPFLQFTCGVSHVRDTKNLAGSSKLLANESRDALHQNGRLAGTSARNHQHGAALVLDGQLLLRIRGEEHAKVFHYRGEESH